MKLKDLTEHLLTESKATYYHGSDYEFDSFNIANAGKTGLAYGIGIYLTSDKEDAMRYGKNVYTVEIPLTPSRILPEKKKFDKRFIIDLITDAPELEDAMGGYGGFNGSNYDVAFKKTVDKLWEHFGPDNIYKLLMEIWGTFYNEYKEDFLEAMVNVGYDGYRKEQSGVHHLLWFNLPELKIISVDKG